MIVFKLTFFLDVGLTNGAEVRLKSNLNVIDADIMIGISLLELSPSESKVFFHLVKEFIVVC